MIVGVSGKKGHGKDLVGSIIQYLTSPDVGSKGSFTECESSGYVYDVKFESKKFADKLKDMVCMLIGCTREQLEDRDFKERELSEEWWVYCTGFYGGIPTNMTPYLGFTPEKHIFKYSLVKLTPRRILQLLGTEAGRDIIHPNIWVNSLMSEYKRTSYWEDRYYGEPSKKKLAGREEVFGELPNWVVTDVRFPNELSVVKIKGGITIRVNRPCKSCGGLGYHKMDCGKSFDLHPSETALDESEFDHVIVNDGSIEDLVEKVKIILIKEKILN